MSFLLSSFFHCPDFQRAGLLVISPAPGFLHIRFPYQELLPSGASAVFGLFLAGAMLRLFQPA